MSCTKKIIWLVVALVVAGAAFWWTTIKKRVVRSAVTRTLQKKTDSLYRITYDTSEIDEVNGDVFLRNVQIKIDSVQWAKLVERDSMPTVTMAITIHRIAIKGLKGLKLLSNRSLDVSGIVLEKPVIRLDKWKRKDTTATANDTLEIYKRLVGNFDFLRVNNIKIVDGQFTLMDLAHRQVFAASGINVDVDDFLVDSAHNYASILSYFVKQTRASIGSIAGSNIRTGKFMYDSRARLIHAEDISFAGDVSARCRTVSITGLSTEAFIYQGAINASRMLLVQPDVLVKPRTGKSGGGGNAFPDGSIDSVVVEKASVTLQSNKTSPVYIKGGDLVIRNLKSVRGQVDFADYLNAASLSCSIASIELPAKLHRINMTHVTYPGTGELLRVSKVEMHPTISRQQLKDKIRKQTDLYNITAKQVVVDRFDLRKMVKEGALQIRKVTTQLDLQVFDDKTLPVDSVKKGRGRFPYEAIIQAKVPINIREVELKNSRIAYEEQAPKTGMNGIIFFTELNGVASNITNIPSLLAKDNVMKIEAGARVMGAGKLQSHWRIPLDAPDVSFTVSGAVEPFPVTALSQPFEKLSLTKLRSGMVDAMRFTINGNREGSKGELLLKYHDLKVDLLKKGKEDDSLEKKGFLSFIANADIRNKNTSDEPKKFEYKRDRYKSLFNLLWKSIFEGGKKTILIVH